MLMFAACTPSEPPAPPTPPTPPEPPAPAVVHVTGVSFSETTLTLEVGEKATLTATVAPDNADDQRMVWTITARSAVTTSAAGLDDTEVEIEAVAPGVATITVTTLDGAKTATCSVTVMPEVDPDDVLTRIPDPVFRAYCESNMEWWDTDANGKLSTEEAATVPSILFEDNWTSIKIASLKGIEYFTGLTQLDCESNSLTELDVSKNTLLNYLYCSDNSLTELDISKNTLLNYLYCSDNSLTELDVSNCTLLTRLFCDGNSLAELDVSNNTALTNLQCDKNSLTELDVSNNTALTWILFINNPGDGVSKFPVYAWFDNTNIPDVSGFITWGWFLDPDSQSVSIFPDYRKAR